MTDYIRLCVDIPEDVYNNMVIKNEYTERDVIAIHNALMDAAVMQSRLLDHEGGAILKVPTGQDPYTVIGQYIRDHITAIEDIIATIEIDGIRSNELFMVDMEEDGYFVWKSDWWEGEKNIALIDFFPVSDAIAERENDPYAKRVINENKKITSNCKNVPWYIEVLRQGVNLGEDTIKDEFEKEKANQMFEEMIDDGLFEEDEQE